MQLTRDFRTVQIFLLIVLLMGTTWGQTFQYSRGWRNGKRSATILHELPTFSRNEVPKSDLVRLLPPLVRSFRADLDAVPYSNYYDEEAMDYPNLNKGSTRAAPGPAAETAERTKWQF